MNKPSSKLFEVVLLKSWWVIIVFLCAFFLFDSAYHKKCEEYCCVQEKISSVTAKKKHAEQRNEALQCRLESQQDPRWIERVLMEKLGLVPEGQKKFELK